MVKPPAKTGKESTNKYAVINIAHRNSDICCHLIFLLLLVIVVIKLIEPKIDLAPAICKENIAKSIALPS